VTDPKYAAFTALDPFFDIVQQGLAGLVDGDHYFDTIADDVEFEFRYHFPGWPETVRGRDALMALYAATATTSSSTALMSSSYTDRRTLAYSLSNTTSMVRLSRPAPHTTTGSSRSLPSRAERSCNGGTIWTRWQP
jgi:hypothetical protein